MDRRFRRGGRRSAKEGENRENSKPQAAASSVKFTDHEHNSFFWLFVHPSQAL
jgi:hypothetical protein